MERPRHAFVVLMCVLLFIQIRVYGAEVEMKVRPGDNITLYSDRSVTLGFRFVWIRNCSHENQPSLVIDFMKLDLEIFKRFSFVHNRSSNSHDLHITNISVSDLGLYYCAEVERKVNKDEKGIISSSEVYYYGNRTTRLSFAEKVTLCSGPSDITSTLPLSDCVLCWALLFSVCPVCVLLSSLCVYCLFQRKTTDAATDQKDHLKSGNTIEGEEEEVCYASLDVITRRQKQRKTKRVQCSDFSTYAQVRTETE
ncbi:uncharacterized protein LOC130071403 isoform X2 [Rhinichthys klamathensis goyatoka]|uniref:uncharacterized protein LOC130071403 isoform X2 n=2 Tax=Rhinichthys klamathensis goyatoka TaxID=3034132 RepID=UPI0024B5C991|nr:uncharacterized protein LOC130071403 isoform X2 [Rhinichthys klamathensis goyatoka]